MAEKKQTLTLPLLVTRGLIVFPGNQKVIEAGRDFSVNAIQAAKNEADSLIFLTTQKSPNIEIPTSDDLYNIGVICRIVSYIEREKSVKARVEVLDRVEFTNLIFDEEHKYFVSQGNILEAPKVQDPKANNAYIEAINAQLESMPALVNNMPKNLINFISKNNNNNLIEVIYSLASFIEAPVEQKQLLLEKDDVESLFTMVMTMIKGEETKSEIENSIAQSVRESTEKSQKEYYLREKLKAIKKRIRRKCG